MGGLNKPDMVAQQRFVVRHEMPTDVLIELVAHCNMRCGMCPQSRLTRPRGTMAFALWKRITDELGAKAPQTRIWPALMGEPFLLGQELFRYLTYAKARGLCHISLNTNLGVFQKQWTDALFESGVDELLISMDGITKQTYERIRVGGRYEVLLENINWLLDEKERRRAEFPTIALQFVVMDENEHEQEAFIDYWKRRGRDVRLKVKPRTGWAAAVPAWKGVREVAGTVERIPCTWLLRQMTILWDGRVPQCDGDWDLKHSVCGDANTQTIEEIWNGELKALREKHLRHDWNYAPCTSCEDWAAGTSQFHEIGRSRAGSGRDSWGLPAGSHLVPAAVPSEGW